MVVTEEYLTELNYTSVRYLLSELTQVRVQDFLHLLSI